MIEGTIKEIRDAEKKADEMVQEAKRQSLKKTVCGHGF